MSEPVTPAAETREVVPELAEFGILAFTTSRHEGSFSTTSREPVAEVMERWAALQSSLAPYGRRLATARQVHGARVLVHAGGWEGWLRSDAADGHISFERGTAMAVSIADCVPVFVAHPSGAAAVLHSGWRGTEAGITRRGIELLTKRRLHAADLYVHLGPAICGSCYEVSAEVFRRLTGHTVGTNAPVDLRRLIADQARSAGVRRISISPLCTRCDNDRFFSHRAGDAGRQLGVLVTSDSRS